MDAHHRLFTTCRNYVRRDKRAASPWRRPGSRTASVSLSGAVTSVGASLSAVLAEDKSFSPSLFPSPVLSPSVGSARLDRPGTKERKGPGHPVPLRTVFCVRGAPNPPRFRPSASGGSLFGGWSVVSSGKFARFGRLQAHSEPLIGQPVDQSEARSGTLARLARFPSASSPLNVRKWSPKLLPLLKNGILLAETGG